MGLENIGEKIETTSFEKDFVELAGKERKVKEKIKAIFQENAELNGALLSEDDLDMTEQQVRYWGGKLKGIRQDARGAMSGLRDATGVEIPKELQEIKAADKHYEEIKKAT